MAATGRLLPGSLVLLNTNFGVSFGERGYGTGYPRIVNGIVDIGAYEWAPPPQIPTLSVWGVALLSAMLGLLGGWPRRRRT